MITEKPFLYWYKTTCYISNGTIYEKNYKERIGYSADNPSILEDFINIDIENLDSIKTFINNYGFLNKEYINYLGAIKETNNGLISMSPYSEDLDFFKEQVLTLKALRVLHSIYLSNEPVDTLVREGSIIQWPLPILHRLSQRTRNYIDLEIEHMKIKGIKRKELDFFEGIEYSTAITYSDKDIKIESIDIMINILNDKIKDVHPALGLSLNFDKINSSWQFNSLLEILYIRYYETIKDGQELRRCDNDKCSKKYFTVRQDKEKRFCTTECAVQGMQNENYKAYRNPDSDKFFPAKIEFEQIYRRLYYLNYNNRIDSILFKEWNKLARKKLKDVGRGILGDQEFVSWLTETGSEDNFLL